MPQTQTGKSNSVPEKATNNPVTRTKTILAALLILVSTSAGFVGGWLGARSQTQQSTGSVEQGRKLAEDQSTLIGNLAREVGPSVVSIDVTSRKTQSDPFFGVQEGLARSAGTGFIISDDGYVLTNRHVIPEGTTKVSLTMYDGTVLDNVDVVGRTNSGDPLDIAFLKINDKKGKTLTVAKIGDSSAGQVGDLVVAIGNALGQFQNTVTSGIISGYGRDVQANDGGQVENLQNLIQTDAAINQGNSGGPLVNVDGEVIRVNTAVAGDGAENIGFAIPINDVKGLIDGVLTNGKVQRPYLGVRYIQLNENVAKELNIDQTTGAYVYSDGNTSAVISGSPAAKAGIKDKDVIIKINDQTIDQNNTLSSVVGRFKVGETVNVTVIRDGKEQTLQATLETMPSN